METSTQEAERDAATPWGSAAELRERMLRPGPGAAPEEVARNQRERLFGATVAMVAARGYAKTRVADLVAASGVSRRSFYDLFPDKTACLLATVEAIQRWAEERLAVSRSGTWKEQANAFVTDFAELVAAQPAAARLCLIDAYGAGPEVAEALDEGFERLTVALRGLAVEEAPLAAISPQTVDVAVGAMLALSCDSLLKGREAELPRLMSQALRLLLDYEPPTGPLEQAPRHPTPAAETVAAPDHTERILRAFVVLAAEVGYENVTIEQLVRRAELAPATFYANFRGTEDVLMAALDSAGAQMVAAILPAFRRNPSWPPGVRAAFDALFGFLAARPALSRLLLVEVYAAGPAALAHRGMALKPLGVLFGEGRSHASGLPAPALDALEGGITWLVRRCVLAEGPEALPALAPLCTYLALSPFIDPVDASAAANRDPWPARTEQPPRETSNADRFLLGGVVLDHLTRAPATLKELFEAMDKPKDEVAAELRRMEEARLVERIEPENGGSEPRYRSLMGVIPTEEWDPKSLTERHRISARVGELIEGDVRRAVDGGSFDARPDRQLVRVALHLDERGWREMGEVHDEALEREIRIRDESARRLAESGGPPIEARSIRALFEMPKPGT